MLNGPLYSRRLKMAKKATTEQQVERTYSEKSRFAHPQAIDPGAGTRLGAVHTPIVWGARRIWDNRCNAPLVLYDHKLDFLAKPGRLSHKKDHSGRSTRRYQVKGNCESLLGRCLGALMHFLRTLIKLTTEYLHFLIGAAILFLAIREGLDILRERADEFDGRVLMLVLLLITAVFIPAAVEMTGRSWFHRRSDDLYPDLHFDLQKPYRIIMPTGFAETVEAYNLVHVLFRRYHFPQDVEFENFRRNKFSVVIVQDNHGTVLGSLDLFCLKEEALKSLLHNWIDEPDFTVEHLEWPAAQTNFYIGAFTARPFALAVGHPPDYLVRQQREWIAKSLVYAMAKMIDRYYLQSDLACGRELHSITLYALGYRATGERWLKLAGFDLEIPRDHRTIRYLVVRHSRFLLSLIGLKNVFTDFVGTKYPVYKLVADRRKVRQFLRKHAGYAEGVNIKLT